MEKDNDAPLGGSLKKNYIPICSDAFGIILLDLNLRDLINFSMTCRKHREISNNNLIWMNQMIHLCPAFFKCCKCCKFVNVNYKEIVREIIYIKKSKYFGCITKINFLKDNILKIILNFFRSKKYCEYINMKNLLENYIKNNLNEIINNRMLGDLFKYCCNDGCISTVKVLFEYIKKNPDAIYSRDIENAFIFACSHSYLNKTNEAKNEVEIVKLFLEYREHNIINLGSQNNKAFATICGSDHTEILKLLLKYSTEYPEIIDNENQNYNSYYFDAFYAFGFGSIENVKLLLDHSITHPGILNPSEQDNEVFIEACDSGIMELIEILFEYSIKYPGIINPFAQKNKVLRRVCKCVKTEILKLFIEYSKKINGKEQYYFNNIKPDFHFNKMLIMACNYENTEIVKILLDLSINNPELINPGAQDSEAFICACCNGSSDEIVKLFLDYSVKYPGIIDIHAQNNKAFISVCTNVNGMSGDHAKKIIRKLLLDYDLKK
jgi:hypothetical protein